MATQGYVNGTITKIKINDVAIDEQIEAKFSFSRDLIPFLNKASGGFTAYEYGKLQWTASGKAHLRYDVTNGYEILLDAMMNKTKLDITFKTNRSGDVEIRGYMLIESLGQDTATEDGVEFDYSFKGTGEPAVDPMLYPGITWDSVNDVYGRVGSAAGLPVSQSPGDEYLPVHRKMRRCLLKDDGTVNYYIDPENPILKEGDAVVNAGTVTSVNAVAVTDESFTSDFDNPVKLANYNLTGGETVTTSDGATTFVKGTDYLIDQILGTITVLSTGNMADATDYLIDYSYADNTFTDAAADFVTGGVQPGQVVKDVVENKAALVVSVDSATQLTLSRSIARTGNGYQVGTANYGGADGQVMVEIPKFYYRKTLENDIFDWRISLYNLPGYTLHPAFVKDGVEVDYRYYSAFEGSMYDASAGAMTAKADIATDLYAAGDKMCSIAGQWAKTYESRAEYRAMAAERGTGWRQLDYYLHSAVQLLYLIEFADFNSQAMIGNGRTVLSGGAWSADSYIGMTGMSILDGNKSNSVSNGGNKGYLTDYMSYRGIENWYGNVWKMIDGMTWDGRWTGAPAAQPVYVTNNAADFLDYGEGNLIHLCDASYIGADSGYISNIEDAIGFIPKTATGSSTTKLADYYYQYSESDRDFWRVPLFGGYATYGGKAGAFALSAYYAWSSASSYFAGRLCF